jgi:hypothetical protein
VGGSVAAYDRGESYCFVKAPVVGEAFPGNIIGGAVIDGGPDKRQAEGDVYAVGKMEQFKRNKSLVVIHADHRVKCPGSGFEKHRVGWIRAGCVDIF